MAAGTWPLTAIAAALVCRASANSTEAEESVWWHLLKEEMGEQLSKFTPEEDRTPPPLPQMARHGTVGTVNLAAEHGYTAESHVVRTADGYLLTIYRLANPGRPVVLLNHALLGSSADFIILGKGKALALILHDAGFDVWLLNGRGTTPSRKHEHLSTSSAKFWDFSWHEIGILDLPASIDHVLKTSGQTQVHYVGFCQGATVFLVMASERPEYMDRIKTFVGLGPVAFPRDIRSYPLRLLSIASNKLFLITRLFGLNEFLPSSKLMTFLAEVTCTDGEVFQPACSNILFLLFGTDTEQMNTTILPDFFANAPAGAASKQLFHYGQLVNHRRLVFRQFDYGRIVNMKRYRNPKPPDYNLSRVLVPSYLIHADNDLLSVQSNIDELVHRLPNIPKDGVRKVTAGHFSHLDFILAKNAKEMVYDDVIDIIQRHEASGSGSVVSVSAASGSVGSTSTTPTSAVTTSPNTGGTSTVTTSATPTTPTTSTIPATTTTPTTTTTPAPTTAAS